MFACLLISGDKAQKLLLYTNNAQFIINNLQMKINNFYLVI